MRIKNSSLSSPVQFENACYGETPQCWTTSHLPLLMEVIGQEWYNTHSILHSRKLDNSKKKATVRTLEMYE